MVAPLALLNVPPLQTVQSSNDVAPSLFPQRPAGHGLHSEALARPVAPLYVPTGQCLHLALVVVLTESEVACVPLPHENCSQVTWPGLS